jgi:acetyl-CoA C-acetyltransferase
MAVDKATPVLVGVGQARVFWNGVDPGVAPSSLSLASTAAAAALADSNAPAALASRIDHVVFVRTMLDSIEGAAHPFGRCSNLPASLAARLGLNPRRSTYSAVGGDQPQYLVNEAAEAVHAGAVRAVLIAGAEATGAMKAALKAKTKLDWSATAPGDLDDRGLGPPLLSTYEMANGLGAPTQTYPAFEHALRARLGLSREAHVTLMSELWATFSQVAATHPFAQFPQVRTAEFLSTASADNYAVADPYLKWHVAQDAVNQGAAVIVTTAGIAAELGISPAKLVYLHGYAQATDRFPTERSDLSRSLAIELTVAQALAMAGKVPAAIEHFDLYSCFPVAVLLASEVLDLDWRTTPATVTGGLPFFGGAGNNYSMHAIATMVERLRAHPADFGLVLANGGFLSKQAVGIYSAVPRHDWAAVSSAAIQQQIDDQVAPALVAASGEAVVDTFTVTTTRGHPSRGYVVAKGRQGRVLARARTGHRATLAALAATDPIGKTVTILHDNGANYIEAAHPIGSPERRFEHVLVERCGHVLEVTLNRPDSLNGLHSAAHFELHEIWDEFERDRELWVAIITGAGDRAFCSGNDLKMTGKGQDMSVPPSGFGGLCARLDREKPIIAALNGMAMGGGLEIALACDLVVIDEQAKVALPEVKVGLFAAAGGVQRLTRQIGRKAAMELILTGRHVGAAEAERLGIVNRVVPSGTALSAARELAETLLANSPSAIRASKQALNKLDEVENLKTALDANGPIIARLFRTQDLREGVTSFVEKRAPYWSNA